MNDSKGNSFGAKASSYDKYGLNKLEIERAIGLLKDFRAKYAFAENPQLIDLFNRMKFLKKTLMK